MKMWHDIIHLCVTGIDYLLLSGVFNESTARGLQFYAESHPEFLQTGRFITFIMNIWKVMSVKSLSKGMLGIH